jgi:hypothetical protein
MCQRGDWRGHGSWKTTEGTWLFCEGTVALEDCEESRISIGPLRLQLGRARVEAQAREETPESPALPSAGAPRAQQRYTPTHACPRRHTRLGATQP